MKMIFKKKKKKLVFQPFVAPVLRVAKMKLLSFGAVGT